ncbi:YjbQ family protein [Candidatus Curtissbacteria bacterium]|nr:YjbQ family protein [Candidatus Curtissbacteria bacterium]
MTFSTLEIATGAQRELRDITEKVAQIIGNSKIKEGIALIFAKHTTCAIIISEIEDDLEEDLLQFLEKEGPKGPFLHSHGDLLAHDSKHAGKSHTPAHILSSIIGAYVQVPIEGGRLDLGTWQRICLLELDGPRNRRVVIQILP